MIIITQLYVMQDNSSLGEILSHFLCRGQVQYAGFAIIGTGENIHRCAPALPNFFYFHSAKTRARNIFHSAPPKHSMFFKFNMMAILRLYGLDKSINVVLEDAFGNDDDDNADYNDNNGKDDDKF